MSRTSTRLFDVAEFLRSQDDMATYLDACIEEANGDAAFVGRALADLARAKGVERVARQVGRPPELLMKALCGEQSPDFGTVLQVISALGLHLNVSARATGGKDSEEL